MSASEPVPAGGHGAEEVADDRHRHRHLAKGARDGQGPGGRIALSPVPIIAVVLMLTGRRAKVNGPFFVLGWPVDLGSVAAIVLVLAGAGGASKSGSPVTWVSW